MRSKNAIKNVISSVSLQAITIICGFIIPKLIITNFGSEVNGLVASITQFLAYITLLESGFGPVVKSVLFKPIANKDKGTIENILKTSEKFFRKIACIFLAYILVLCIVFSTMFAGQFDAIFTLSMVVIIAISTFAEYYFGMTYKLYIYAEQKNYVLNFIQIGMVILNTIAVILLIHFGASIQIVKLASCFIFILRPIIQNLYVKKKYKINLRQAKDDYKIEQKWEGLAQHIAYVVHKNTDIVILTICGCLADISVYSVYLIVINAVKNVTRSFIGGLDATLGDMFAKGENDKLRKSFKAYEGYYLTIATIMFSATLFLITPFISLYTKGITDANYIVPEFAAIMVLAEFVWAIRQPYNDLIKVAGHFKQTRVGAWVEAISNMVISFILVWKFGLVGVAIGTLFAMAFRTIEFMYHTSKYILNRSIWESFKRLIVIGLEVGVLALILNIIPKIEIVSYQTWALYSVAVASISAILVITTNCLIFKPCFLGHPKKT
ncbi:MAG: polysaccharide biosynthesis C-terminal domain-containing protein [Clostridia bacterium]|nr:polysaccharide biosynthesis C-terminal domain-containing protein [Clostridia bacterium]